MKHITIAVTNDIEFDQRVGRIANSLHNNNYKLTIVGRDLKVAYKSSDNGIKNIRLKCIFNTGFLFYLEYNLRLFFILTRQRPDVIYACDPDTLIGSTFYKIIFAKKGVYDAHELFTETPEINDRKLVKWIWKNIEKSCSKYMNLHLTVNQILVERLSKKLNAKFNCIRNLPFIQNRPQVTNKENVILYQGVLNKGRGIEALIEMMDYLPEYILLIAGNGDIADQLKNQAQTSNARHNIKFLGKLSPDKLKNITKSAKWGYNLLDGSSENYYLSLANKFFDYMAGGVPSINMNFPLYKLYVEEYQCGILLKSIDPSILAKTIKIIDLNDSSYQKLVLNSLKAHQILNWENEEIKLLKLVNKMVSN